MLSAMERKYVIKLKGTNCYLKNIGDKSVNFTTDRNKAKAFVNDYKKKDLIDKLVLQEYKVRKESHKCDHINLTMDKETWQELYNEHLDQLQVLSDNRLNVHQYSISLVNKFEAKAKSYSISKEFPNFECVYYGEDFEREEL